MKLRHVLSLLLLGACETTARDGLSSWGEYVPDPDDPIVTDTAWDTSAPTDTGDTGDIPTTIVVETGSMQATVSLGFEAYRFGRQSDQASPCVVEVATSANADELPETTCQLDANELDLYFHGWGYGITIPARTCEYLRVSNYKYQAFPIGTGPAVVEWVEDPDGNWIEDIANAVNGKPHCEFDFSGDDGPNCCYGNYRVQRTVRDGGGGETVQPLEDPTSWGGGKVGECYAGAAFTSSITAIDADSALPLDVIVDLDERVDNLYQVTFNAPIDKPESASVTVANYLNPADPVPSGFQGDYSQPLYVIDCLDKAHEIFGRINLVVREWDQVSEFEADGNPDSGMEGGLEPNGAGPINDFFDWRDFEYLGIDWVLWYD